MAENRKYNYRNTSDAYGRQEEKTARSSRSSEGETAQSTGTRQTAASGRSTATRTGSTEVKSASERAKERAAQKAAAQQRKYHIRRAIVAILAILIITLLILGIVKLVRKILTPKPQVEAPVLTNVLYEAADSGPAIEQLLTDTGRQAVSEGTQIAFAESFNEINFHVLGAYKVNVECTALDGTKETYPVTITVQDTVPPVAVAKDNTVQLGTVLTVGDFIEPDSVYDMTDVAVSLAETPDYTKVGTQTVDILLEDRGGNQTRLTASLTIWDTEAEEEEAAN